MPYRQRWKYTLSISCLQELIIRTSAVLRKSPLPLGASVESTISFYVIHKCFTIWSLQNLCLLLKVSFRLRLGFTSTHNTIRLLLHGNSSWSKAGTRPFKAVAVLKSWELLLSQLRQFFLSRLLPFSLEPCQICLKGLEWKKICHYICRVVVIIIINISDSFMVTNVRGSIMALIIILW